MTGCFGICSAFPIAYTGFKIFEGTNEKSGSNVTNSEWNK